MTTATRRWFLSHLLGTAALLLLIAPSAHAEEPVKVVYHFGDGIDVALFGGDAND